MFTRAFNPSNSVLAPLRRTRDPLVASSVARHFVLPSGNSFIVRPPPSVVPPTVPLASTTTTTETPHHPFLDAIVGSSSSSSPSRSPDPASLPRTRRTTTPSLEQPSPRLLDASEVAELQRLRETTSRRQLARQFGISPAAVARFGYGKGQHARQVEREKRVEVRQEQDEREAQWGWKKSIAREERKRRRSMW